MNNTRFDTECISFFQKQMHEWPAVNQRFTALQQQCKTKNLSVNECRISVQYNPARVQSAKAKTDKASIRQRPCFLCEANRPAEQTSLPILEGYQLLVNPFPILPVHFTIVSTRHRPQEILREFTAYQTLLDKLSGFIVFYNGPKCGASAPDHLHFQAGSRGYVPIEADWKSVYESNLKVSSHGIFLLRQFPVPVFVIQTHRDNNATPIFRNLYQALNTDKANGEEPMLNLLGWQEENGEQIILVFPRKKHRPDAYFYEDDRQISISPGAIDMGGLLIAINEQDYQKVTASTASHILKEVGITLEQADEIWQQIHNSSQELPSAEPEIQVGILSDPTISFLLKEPYLFHDEPVSGKQTVSCQDNRLLWNGKLYDQIELTPEGEGCFSLPEVTIGIQFHWQKKEEQTFKGGIRLLCHQDKVVFINKVKVETYLSSVICSEMNSECPYEFLKASAIISRSWVLSQILQKNEKRSSTGICGYSKEQEIIRWYEQSDHKLFDVCADDHCQRYQGIGRIKSGKSLQAVTETQGEVLLFDGEICDARFSKCCGGMTEEYAYCWDDRKIPYLISHSDSIPSTRGQLSSETAAEQWIKETPSCFCNTQDATLLKQILNHYDQSTQDFFRWKVTYTQSEISRLLKEKMQVDFGTVLDIVPIERGPGGHISRLKIIGSLCTRIVGKELEIRKMLSQSHLYSSAFIVEKGENKDGAPQHFTLYGAGWGHGVGMCQIGAAVMGKKGYDYRQILAHYYPHAIIKKLY